MQRQCYFDHINQIKHCRFCILLVYLQNLIDIDNCCLYKKNIYGK